MPSTILYEVEVFAPGMRIGLMADCRCIDDEHAVKYAPKLANRLVRKSRARGDEIADLITDWTVRRAYGYGQSVLGRGLVEAVAA